MTSRTMTYGVPQCSTLSPHETLGSSHSNLWSGHHQNVDDSQVYGSLSSNSKKTMLFNLNNGEKQSQNLKTRQEQCAVLKEKADSGIMMWPCSQ